MDEKTIEAHKFPRPLPVWYNLISVGFFRVCCTLFVIVPAIIFITTDVVSAKQLSAGTLLHHFQLPCNSCHDSNPVGDAQRGTASSVGKIKGDINQLCTQSGCHNYDPALNHPIGVRPGGRVPSAMVLDGQSRITCLTCHDSTNSSEVQSSFDSGQDRILCRPEGIQFCGSCHTQMGGNLKKQSHWQFSTRAHLGSINPQSASSENFSRFIGGIDTESRTCLSCHTDVSAIVPGENETQQQRVFRRRDMTDHPIGMDYRQVAVSSVGGFNFPLMDNQQIRLFNGQVGCGSCHSPYAQTKNNLVISSERGILCRACHNK